MKYDTADSGTQSTLYVYFNTRDTLSVQLNFNETRSIRRAFYEQPTDGAGTLTIGKLSVLFTNDDIPQEQIVAIAARIGAEATKLPDTQDEARADILTMIKTFINRSRGG
jgi:hypothetical protein